MFAQLKKEVCDQNRRLSAHNLVILTEGNVSAISPDRKFVVIKPSGVSYENLRPSHMVVVDMRGRVVEGSLRPSTDTLTHMEIYKKYSTIGGIAHTHSTHATIFAQMRKPIPCYGTTHADLCGEIPVTRHLTKREIENDYEVNTGKIICEILSESFVPCVLVASHGPFTFGAHAGAAVDHAYTLEKIATMAILGSYSRPINTILFRKHHERKHGKNRYYGQT